MTTQTTTTTLEQLALIARWLETPVRATIPCPACRVEVPEQETCCPDCGESLCPF